MKITTTITKREYIYASLHVLYSIKIIKIMFMIFAGFILFAIPYLFGDKKSISIFIIVVSLITPAIMIGLTAFNAKRLYARTTFMSEPIDYTFGESMLTLKSSSFKFEFQWEIIFKITKSNHWLLIWTNNQLANPIARKHITEEQMAYLKTILDRNKVKNNL